MSETAENKESEEEFDLGQSLFAMLVYSLNMTALQQLGKVVNPMTGKLNKDMEQAQLTIDMIHMLSVKTQNNLQDEESQFLEKVINQLEQTQAQLSAQ